MAIDDDISPETLRAAHDHFFRRVFSNPLHARGVLQRMLPAELVAALDWPSLRLVPGSYVDQQLRSSYSDLVFEVATLGGTRALLHLLVEHQRSQDPLMPLRLLDYGARCLKDYVRRHRLTKGPLPHLVPLVLYQGPRRWTAPRRLSALCPSGTGLPPRFEVDLLVHELDAESVEMLAAALELTALARAALIAMKLVAARRDLSAHAALFGRLLREVRLAHGVSGLRPLLVYLLRTRGGERELRAIMNATDSQTRVIVQTAYDKLIARGRAEGEASGLAKGKADMLLQLLQARFGSVPAEVVARVRSAAVSELDAWAQQLLRAGSLDELFD